MTSNKGVLIGVGIGAAIVLLCGGLLTGVAVTALAMRKGPSVALATPKATQAKVAMPATTPKAPPTLPVRPPEPPPPRYAKDKVPNADDLRRLTTASLLDFDNAVKTKDIKGLQAKLSRIWQGPMGLENLTDFVGGAIGNKADFSGVKDVVPTFNPPAQINADGHLIVEGLYAAKPQQVKFKLDYVWEDDTWKLNTYRNLSYGSAPPPG
jgi:hypothetical protein